jgi:kynurenine formamidase
MRCSTEGINTDQRLSQDDQKETRYPMGGEPWSNWSRWGPDDQRGTLNLLGPRAVVEAATLVKTGKVYPLAIPVEAALSSPMREGALHISTVRKDATESKRQVAIDVIALHTHDFTHMDSLAHVGYGGFLYNGVPAESIGYNGAERLGIQNIGAIAGRAILADVARTLGADSLEAGYAITAGDLERTLRQEGVEPRSGDILLVRTGWITRYLADRTVTNSGWPGIGLSTVQWLHDHSVCAVGADNVAVEVKPFEDERRSFIVHERFIRDHGGYLIEFMNLEELASEEVYESFFILAPLYLSGGLGSPVTPVAIG